MAANNFNCYFVFDFINPAAPTVMYLTEADLNAAIANGTLDPTKFVSSFPNEGVAAAQVITSPCIFVVPSFLLHSHSVATVSGQAVN